MNIINILYLHAGAEMYGADKVLLNLITNLDKGKFKPIVILPCNGLLYDALICEGVETIIIPYPILRRKYFNFKGIIKYIISYFKYSKQILTYIKKRSINILHINTCAVLEGIYIRFKLKVPIIWHVHEIIIKPKLIYYFTCFILHKYGDAIVVVSNAVKQHLIKSNMISNNKVKVIYNGVDSKIFNSNVETLYLRNELDIPKESIIIGMIGRVNAWKGQNDFLDALEKIMIDKNNVYAILVGGVFNGEEWRLDLLVNRIETSLYKDRIRILNFRSDSPNLHNLFDVFVLPSTNPDPLPTVVLEAMACSKPVVGYRHGGICEMVEHGVTGLLVDVCNPEDLADKIISIINNDNLYSSMGKLGNIRQNNLFSLNSYVNKFSELYSKSIN